MRSLLATTLAAALAAVALGCSHPGAAGPALAARGIKHAIAPLSANPELQESPLTAMFEQSFCSAMFELNDKQVVCADDVRSLLRIEAERATLGSPTTPVDELEQGLDAPRHVALTAVRAGEAVVIRATVLERSGRALGHFEERVAADGSDLPQRARHLGESVLSVP